MMFGIEVCMLKIIRRKATCFGVEINHHHARYIVIERSKKCDE